MNPAFNSNHIDSLESSSTDCMTVSGAIAKTAFLTAVCGTTAAVTWNFAAALGTPVLFGALILGLITAMVTVFKPNAAPFTAPVYAIFEGIVLGLISAVYAKEQNGIVGQAILITFGILAAMLGLYQSRIIVVTDKLRGVIRLERK